MEEYLLGTEIEITKKNYNKLFRVYGEIGWERTSCRMFNSNRDFYTNIYELFCKMIVNDEIKISAYELNDKFERHISEYKKEHSEYNECFKVHRDYQNEPKRKLLELNMIYDYLEGKRDDYCYLEPNYHIVVPMLEDFTSRIFYREYHKRLFITNDNETIIELMAKLLFEDSKIIIVDVEECCYTIERKIPLSKLMKYIEDNQKEVSEKIIDVYNNGKQF